ncbi:hypothetical protein ACHAXA_002221 [Cyclostephanos tholiformis]|uniref:Uncharacterized protein n=1 Tax=Cyclostephanos tholiformis TaxID=382380 RepID=A0ABD3RWX9_9STRA
MTDDDGTNSPERPHLYSDAVVSAPLITWFGLPTLIELEQPTNAAPDVPIPAIPEASEFTPLRGGTTRARSYSQPRADQQQQPRQHRMSKSYFDVDDDTHAISAYTYRVRTLDNQSLDEHRLLLCQNPDGSYSHVAPNEDEIDDVTDSKNGPLMISHGENLKASMSLDAVMNLEETLAKMDDGTLPPHIHPLIPTEILNPEYARTTPALKMWTLAVLVFYS